MSTKFIPLAERFWVSPQITPGDVSEAASMGIKMIINNRPDGEESGQPTGADVETAAKNLGLAYVEIPVKGAGVSDDHLDKFDAALRTAEGPVLAYCRSGARSTIVRALARARAGDPIEAIIAEAAAAGYNIAGVRSRLKALSRET